MHSLKETWMNGQLLVAEKMGAVSGDIRRRGNGMADDDGLGDWRNLASARLAEPVPAAFPGGPSHQTGDTFHQSALVRDAAGQPIGFTLPSATALALNISIQSRNAAIHKRRQLEFHIIPTPLGSGRSVTPATSAMLFDYFENCMSVVTFSYQALGSGPIKGIHMATTF